MARTGQRGLCAAAVLLAGLGSAWPVAAQSYDPYATLGRPRPLDRLMEYERGGWSRQVRIDDRLLVVKAHPRDPTLLIQRNVGAAFLQGAAEGLSLGVAPAALSDDVYSRAAAKVLKAAGCRLVAMRPLDGRVSWEAEYACPSGARIGR